MKPIRREEHRLPLFSCRGLATYRVHDLDIRLQMTPDNVFPPSETSLVLAEIVAQTPVESALDIGTGCGVLAISLALTGCRQVTAIDCNSTAIACARENARLNGLENRIEFLAEDAYAYQPESRFDLVVTNPPFLPIIPGRRFRSDKIMQAIDGGAVGADHIVGFARRAKDLLAPTGKFVVAVPHFVSLDLVLSKLKELYSLRLLRQEPIRFWLAEYDPDYRNHIIALVAKGVSEASESREGLVMSKLSVFECSPYS
ncbi:MAG: methyltransferase [bacterium]